MSSYNIIVSRANGELYDGNTSNRLYKTSMEVTLRGAWPDWPHMWTIVKVTLGDKLSISFPDEGRMTKDEFNKSVKAALKQMYGRLDDNIQEMAEYKYNLQPDIDECDAKIKVLERLKYEDQLYV